MGQTRRVAVTEGVNFCSACHSSFDSCTLQSTNLSTLQSGGRYYSEPGSGRRIYPLNFQYLTGNSHMPVVLRGPSEWVLCVGALMALSVRPACANYQ